MIITTVGTLTWAATTFVVIRQFLGPALFRRMTRRRIAALALPTRPKQHSLPLLARRHVNAGKAVNEHERLALLLDNMGRELRLGNSLHGALLAAMTRHPVQRLSWLADVARDGGSLRDAAHDRLTSSEFRTERDAGLDFVLRVVIAVADGADPVHAAESAARTLRTSAEISADSRAAVAHTLASIRVLTWVPVALAVLLASRDESIRRFFFSVTGLLCVGGGMALNWTGRRITARLTAKAIRVESEIPDFTDMIAVHLRAGKPPAMAFLHSSEAAAGTTGIAARRVTDDFQRGERFVDALLANRNMFDLRAQPLVDALVDTERDGLPPRELFERLADEAKTQRRRDADQRLRALPVQLALPLVGCVLPAYVLLAVIPLLVGQFSSVNLDPL